METSFDPATDLPPTEAPPDASQFESFIGSLLFWLIFLIASGMYAAFVLTPKLTQIEQLRQQKQGLDERIALRDHEIGHLTRLATALESDPEFISRVAESEFSTKSVNETRIELSEDLGFDARIPQRIVVSEPAPRTASSLTASLQLPIQKLAQPGTFRTRWGMACAVMFFVAFVFLSDAFLSGAIGHLIVRGFLAAVRRYRVSE